MESATTLVAPLVAPLVAALPYAGIGLTAGVAFFSLMRINVRWYLRGDATVAAVALHVGRLAGVAGVFWWCAQPGQPWPLLLALAGFLVGRLVVARWPLHRPGEGVRS